MLVATLRDVIQNQAQEIGSFKNTVKEFSMIGNDPLSKDFPTWPFWSFEVSL